MSNEREGAGPGARVGTGAAPGTTPAVRWDESDMRSAYANVVNVVGTREEIAVLFGTHRTQQGAGPNFSGAATSSPKEVTAHISDRFFLSPYGAKRLHILLTLVLREYESRYGALKLEGVGQTGPGEPIPVPGS